jgi:hypothetical protein
VGPATVGHPDGAGAYAGLAKTSTMCLGGSCDDGGSLVYQSSYQYDPHRRTCSVQTINPAAQLILGSHYVHDQYDNLISESHSSELDSSDESNYQVAYTYDGLMRLVFMSRSDSDDNPLETISYEYNAASNITKKVKTSYE